MLFVLILESELESVISNPHTHSTAGSSKASHICGKGHTHPCLSTFLRVPTSWDRMYSIRGLLQPHSLVFPAFTCVSPFVCVLPLGAYRSRLRTPSLPDNTLDVLGHTFSHSLPGALRLR